jgi:hypothetical protein
MVQRAVTEQSHSFRQLRWLLQIQQVILPLEQSHSFRQLRQQVILPL